MEAAAALRSSVGIYRGPVNSGFFSTRTAPDLVGFGFKSSVSAPWIKLHPSASHVRYGNQNVAFRSAIRASLPPSSSGDPADPIAPLQFESPVGQFLSQVMINHPHLVPAAVDQQLKQLQAAHNVDIQKDELSVSGAELVLYRRIAEVKANERKKALEEILYALVVQKFMDADVPLIPALTLSSSDSSGRVDTWPNKDEQFPHIHSPEAYGMIQNHLALILGNRLGDNTSETQISKFRVGQVYAASVMYGYFLKRVDQRFQLEKTMKILPKGTVDGNMQVPKEKFRSVDDHNDASLSSPESGPEVELFSFSRGVKQSKLRSYVMSLDGETLQRYATIRSKEAIRIIEKHTEALFGRPEIAITPQGTIDPSEENVIRISFGGLKRLLLEAAAFGSFLWDVESYVDSMCHFVTS
ncbi:unnamed protein product [Cuscuta campestris]|uniref:UV-B-induced protein At3g17800, chloroplastic n=2 Tax=Cuscuta sect. Cleistogrammica TaxID=1824901 RepID=A0A484K4P5_9ASTE|nr:hypothetical protein DM860_008111 [Cuscuta australis]VFQ59505.1 unnamed protein product [Cuscuta campestris]